jgi:demethylspheroidene O-methyltransferase
LVRVAHDHDDATVLTVLRAIHRALPLGGSLLLAEPMAETGKASSSDPYFHFYLMAMGSGRLRTSDALSALLAQAGFTHIERIPNPMPLHTQILLGRKSQCLP